MMFAAVVRRMILLATVGLVAATDRGASASTPQDSEPAPTPVTARDRTESNRTTAEELLRELQRRRPVNSVIPPSGARDRANLSLEPKLWPEGWTVLDHPGRLERVGAWWVFHFQDSKAGGSVKVLPNAALEVMVHIQADSENANSFTISGEMTVFGLENYLLVRTVRRRAAASPSPTVTEPESDSAPQAPIAADASVEDVLAVMEAQQPVDALLAAEGLMPSHDDAVEKKAYAARALRVDGSPLVSRLGRIVPRGDWWAFRFESTQADAPDPPIKLLPSKNTERMVQAREREKVGLVFVVSGEITAFEGENFLLPRLAVQRIDLGNLRK
ncbi:MAG: hypothetical protein IID38_10875 [Planctomycetes bacterium]|nr:hypothetical protein [Planctomycetota bacterium]